MRFQHKSLLFTLLLSLPFPVFAAKDPVAWQLNRLFQSPVFAGRTYNVTYTFTSQLPFTMQKAMVIAKNASPASEFTYTDSCTGTKLAPNQSCNVQVAFAPLTAGNKSLQLTIQGYDNNKMVLPAITTVSTSSTIESIYATVTQPLPYSTDAGQSQTYTITFTNNGSTALSNVSTAVTQTSGTASFSTTCGATLGAGNSCSITGGYTPVANISVQTVTGQLNYGTNSSVSASTSTNVTSTTGVVASIVGNYYLPAEMIGGTETLWFLFTNNGPGTATMGANATPITVTTGSSVGSISYGADDYNHCANAALSVGQACDVKATFTATTVASPTPVTVQAQVSFTGSSGSPATIDTQTTVVSTIGTSRTINFYNNCGFPVWFSLNGGQLNGSPTCTTSPDSCTNGTTCSPITHKCFWTNITPNGPGSGGSAYELAASGGTNSVTIPATSADPAIQWSGNISASLGCDGSSSCVQAACSNAGGSTGCLPGQGFAPPATQAEITMNLNTNDSYDVEVINGFHIPISMAPGPYVNVNGYTCGTPGSYTSGNGFGACDWSTATIPGNGYYWVTSGGASCNISSPSCSTVGQVCGLDANLNQSCGDFLGYWTADQVCGMNNIPSAVNSYFKCSTPLSSISSSVTFSANTTLYNLMSCAVPTGDVSPEFNSCYLTYSGNPSNNEISCCGCIDWWTLGYGSNPNTQSCTQPGQASPQTDPVWNQYIQSGVAWLKKACPSDYVYPFDDKTSGFSCTNTLPNQANSVGYTITFCAGNSGLPASVTEGRT